MDATLNQQQVTREILWNLSHSEEILMYVSTLVATLLCLWGFFRRWKVYTKGQPGGLGWDQPLKRLTRMLKEILLHRKLRQRQYDGIQHALVFYGFMLLMFVTFMVGLEHDTPLHFFFGPTYLGLSFLGDLGGIMVIAGLAYFAWRRYIEKPAYIQSTRPWLQADGFMMFMLLLLVLQGYGLEMLRIAHKPENFEWPASFVGWPLAHLVISSGMAPETMLSTHHGLWLFHMLTTMSFIALLPFTKFSHIIMGVLNTYTQRMDSKGALRPIKFAEMEGAESFGLSKLKEFTSKQRLAMDTCVECGRCEVVCPANFTQKPLSPKAVVVKLRDRMWQEEKQPEMKDKTLFETNTFSFDEIFSCTTCGACMQECPVNIEHVEMILDLKRHYVMTQGQVPPTAGDMVRKVQNNGNPWGIAQEDRMKWADGLDVPVADPQKKVDYLYYVGCAGSYDDRNKKVVHAVISLLKKANVSFAVIGKDEKCNGDPVRRVGDEYAFSEIAIERVDQLKKYQFDKVVAHCPHCFHTIGAEYKAFGGDFSVVHHSQLLAELMKEGRLKPTKPIAKEMVFHDPCYLGRHHGEYDAPRFVLENVPGLQLKEQPRQKEKSFCCGMGGGNMWYEMKQGTSMTATRMGQLQEASKNIASSCSFCLINFEFGKSTSNKFENMSVQDIAEILREATE